MRARHITTTIITLTTSLFVVNIASALTYSDNVGIEFTFNPTINVSITGDLSIDELVPGGYSDSNIVNVNVATNNSNGYYLSANVGSSTNNPSTELRLSNYNANDGSNGSTNPIFTSLLTTDSYSSMGNDNISPNTWGYSYSSDNGTTWSNYSGLPLYNTAGIKLKEKYNPSNDTINFKIAAKASNNQVSGTYNNTITFTALANPETRYYMQEFPNSLCQTLASDNNYTVYDIRDNNAYTVRYINGQCWMTQNLRFTGTSLSPNTSNVTSNKTLTYYSLDANDETYANHCDDTNGYNYACVKNSNDTTTGVWYNYYAASAGTIATDSNTTPATNSICPNRWHLPSGPNTTVGTDFNKLIGNTISGWQNQTTGLAVFEAIAGGWYRDGALDASGTRGCWWTATTTSSYGVARFDLDYGADIEQFYGNDSSFRYRGFFLRCVTD